MSTDDQLVADYLRRLATAAESLPADRRDELIEEISAHIAEARALIPGASGEATTSVADTLARLGQPDDIVRAAAEQADTAQLGGLADIGLIGGGAVGWAAGSDGEAIGGAPPGTGEPVAGAPVGTGAEGFGGASTGYVPSSSQGYGPTGYGPGGFGPGGAYVSWPSSSGPPRPDAAGMGVMEIFAVILLLVGGFLAGIGWIVGAILLWISPRWRLSDKLLGTLIWPGGLAAVIFVLSGANRSGACSGSSGAGQAITHHCANQPGAMPGWLGLLLALVVLGAGVGGPILVATRLVRQARRAAQHYPAAA
ncbi:MAG: HAAS signaling domain-containing protein [Streptosporangiaceae bacterium]